MIKSSSVRTVRKLRLDRSAVAVLVVTLAALVLPATGKAATASAPVNLSRTTISVGEPAIGRVNVHMKFASVASVCFAFTFSGDLLDPGEELDITPLRALPSGTGPGFINDGTTPQAERTLCLSSTYQPDLVALFTDGKENGLEFSMRVGSVHIASLVVTVEGVPRTA
jgi:hypothetical protein